MKALAVLSKVMILPVLGVTLMSAHKVVPPVASNPLFDLQHGTVLIEVERDGRRGQGTGIVVRASNGEWFIWTVAHVVEDAQQPDGSFQPVLIHTRSGGVLPADIVRLDNRNDVALLRVSSSDIDARPVRFQSNYDLTLGEQVTTVGNPEGDLFPWTVTTGIVSYIGRTFQGLSEAWTQVSSPVWFGSSGSGVYVRRDGGFRCIGLVSQGLEESFILIVPDWRIEAFARREGVLFAFNTDLPVPAGWNDGGEHGNSGAGQSGTDRGGRVKPRGPIRVFGPVYPGRAGVSQRHRQ